jgi:hypothetical protein
VVPFVDPAVRGALEKSREGGDPLTLLTLQQKGLLPKGPIVDSAAFTVVDGVILPPEEEEGRDGKAGGWSVATGGDRGGNGIRNITAADQVIPDDLIVQGSLCTGFDCVNNESFSFDTIRLRENNLRIHFDDTSTIAGYPSRDWRIIANDSASGGASKFSIEDSTGALTPFTLTAGAPSNSMFVGNGGRVGLRTATPTLDLHINTSNTPSIRLEQNSSGGFSAQTWDIAGNEANFFIRDVTGGSTLPFRIRPGAPTSSIDINADGQVGFGTASADHNIDVSEAGAVEIAMTNTSGTDVEWFLQVDADTNKTFKISQTGTGGSEVTIDRRLDANGATLRVDGSVQATNVIFSSSRALKHDVRPVDPLAVLAKLRSMPVSEWRFLQGPQEVRHIGPMAEDFQQLFGVGSDGQTISVTDINGVALAAIQGLSQVVGDREQEIEHLRTQNEELAARLARLEARLLEMAGSGR